ncbi:G-protein coupled receptor GRL101-like [Littorina saxatilis]|uniref:G-protein coupled receptor GRL101-like n=1 Tax=Littorina saxatilis TaxID=31220 RepID=UPI0038B435BF
MTQCTDGSDEVECGEKLSSQVVQLPPPAIITMDGRGGFHVIPLNHNVTHAAHSSSLTGQRNVTGQMDASGAMKVNLADEENQSFATRQQNTSPSGLGGWSQDFRCPETHFQCPGEGYCLPVYLRCNAVHDCPGREDEAGCDRHTCPGFYRCRGSAVCLHAEHVCDGVYHCPQQDDELFCHLACPLGCTCYGHAVICPAVFPAQTYPDLRFVDASFSGMTPSELRGNGVLVYLRLAFCGLRHADHLAFPNLRILDLGHNSITDVSVAQLAAMRNLHTLILSANPFVSLFPDDLSSARTFTTLRTLDLSWVNIPHLNASVFPPFTNIRSLNLSHCGIEDTVSFTVLSQLRVLDLRGCPVTSFPQTVFAGLDKLHTVFADNYKLCCPTTLPPHFALSGCTAPFNEISSCQALLRSDIYRVFLSVFAVLSLLGNLGSFVARVFVHKTANATGFGIFVTHLCVSDFLMGVYLAIVGVADRMYLGSYVWEDVAWRHSAACKVAGFLSLLSSEVSALIICLITLDRFLVLRFPFSAVHFRRFSASAACVGVWMTGLVLAAIPLLPATAHWNFYSSTGICVPLPVTRSDAFPGHHYSFAVLIVFNFVLFLLIAAGQASIYASVRANSMSDSDSTLKSRDASVARRLIAIAVTDFLCWFPIGLLGLLAVDGVGVSGEVNVALAIIALPVNSALNPFLYTLNKMLEHRRRVQEARLRKMLVMQMISKFSVSQVSSVSRE